MSLTLQQVLDALADENGAEALTELLHNASRDDLAAVEAEALETFDTVRQSEELQDDDIATLEALASAVETVRGEGTRREEAAAELAERINAVAERISSPGEAPPEETPSEENVDEEETVAASARPAVHVNVADIARRRARPAPPEQTDSNGRPSFDQVFFSAADVPGFSAGQGFKSFDEFSAAFLARAASRPGTKVGVARIKKFGFKARIPEGMIDITSALTAASNPEGLTSAGWCSPSEIWYDLCPSTVARTGLFSLPETNAPRGGVQFSRGFDLSSISASGFRYTEAELIAGVTKPCIIVPCPEFETEVRLGVEGICVATDIPMDSTYPEAVTRYLELVLALHAKSVSGSRLKAVWDGSTDKGTVGTSGEGALSSFFTALEVMGLAYRNVHSANWDETVEVVLPSWVRAVLRADVIKRTGIDSGENAVLFADSVINAGLALRNVQPQWVNTSHPGDTNDVLQLPADWASTGPAYLPDTVDVLMYFPGTWIALTKDVIDVSTIYDSVNLSQNKFTQLFMENGVAVINRCNRSFKFTVPVCANGVTASTDDIACAAAPIG